MNATYRISRLGCILVAAMLTLLAGCASKAPAPVVERSGARSASGTYVVKSGDTLYSIAREHGMDFRELIALNAIQNPSQIAVGRVLKVRSRGEESSAAAAPTVVTAPITTEAVISRPLGEAVLTERPVAATGELLKREPRAGKEPYSDQLLAQLQGAVAPKPEETTSAKPEEKPAEAPPVEGRDEIAWNWPAKGKVIGTFSENGSKGIDIAGKAGDPVLAAGDGKVVYVGTGLRGYGKLVIIKHNTSYLSAYAHNRAILVEEGQSVSKGQKIAEMGNTDADQVKLHFEVRRDSKPVDPLKHLPPR